LGVSRAALAAPAAPGVAGRRRWRQTVMPV